MLLAARLARYTNGVQLPTESLSRIACTNTLRHQIHFATLSTASLVPNTLSVFPNSVQNPESNGGIISMGLRCTVSMGTQADVSWTKGSSCQEEDGGVHSAFSVASAGWFSSDEGEEGAGSSVSGFRRSSRRLSNMLRVSKRRSDGCLAVLGLFFLPLFRFFFFWGGDCGEGWLGSSIGGGGIGSSTFSRPSSIMT